MTKKQQKEKRAAIFDRVIKPRTHKLMSVKMPVEFAELLKKEANEKRYKLSGYVLTLIEKGKEAL